MTMESMNSGKGSINSNVDSSAWVFNRGPGDRNNVPKKVKNKMIKASVANLARKNNAGFNSNSNSTLEML